MYISEIVTTVPENVSERVPLEQKVYKVFDKLGIPFERVDNDPASSMEECRDIGKVSWRTGAERCVFVQPEEDYIFPSCNAGGERL